MAGSEQDAPTPAKADQPLLGRCKKRPPNGPKPLAMGGHYAIAPDTPTPYPATLHIEGGTRTLSHADGAHQERKKSKSKQHRLSDPERRLLHVGTQYARPGRLWLSGHGPGANGCWTSRAKAEHEAAFGEHRPQR